MQRKHEPNFKTVENLGRQAHGPAASHVGAVQDPCPPSTARKHIGSPPPPSPTPQQATCTPRLCHTVARQSDQHTCALVRLHDADTFPGPSRGCLTRVSPRPQNVLVHSRARGQGWQGAESLSHPCACLHKHTQAQSQARLTQGQSTCAFRVVGNRGTTSASESAWR